MIPSLTLNDGNSIPAVGFGTWRLPDKDAPAVIDHALQSGYRHFDTAHAYNNEAGVGRGIAESGISRDQLFITTKLWNTFHGFEEARKAFDASLRRLALAYVDLYLIHWPVPMKGKYVDTWRALVDLQKEGLIRSIGVSNFTEEHLKRLVDETGVTPAVNQIELHPRFQQRSARSYHKELGIQIESWSPLGQGNVVTDDTLMKIGKKHSKSATQVILRWHLDQGLIVIPRSKTPSHINENLAIADFALDEQDMLAISGMDTEDGRIGPVPDELGAVALPKAT